MSLKAFHVVFITAASGLAFGCAAWWLRDFWSEQGRLPELILGLGSLAVGVGLIFYERYFLKKLRKVGYL